MQCYKVLSHFFTHFCKFIKFSRAFMDYEMEELDICIYVEIVGMLYTY